MINKRTLLISAVMFTLIGISAAWWLTTAKTPSARLEKLSLRLQWLHQAQFAGFYVAKEKGFYREAGLDVAIQPGGQDFNAVTLVSSGSDDVGVWTADQVLLAYARGVPIRAVGVVFDRSLTAFMVKQTSTIRTPKDFEGKTVGMYYGYDSETIYLALLKRFNVDRNKIRETALQYDLSRFFNGDVDVWPAYVINQPLAAQAAGVEVRLLKPDDLGIRYYSDTIIITEKTLHERRDTVTRFLSASERGWRYALDHRDEATDIVLKQDPHLNRAHQRQMLDVTAQYLRPRGAQFGMDRGVWESIISLLREQKLLHGNVNVDKLVDFKLPEDAHAKISD
ncbi:MAG: ABC transporter substrate-binding protein [bacterium]|uniref:Thiamine pyrimidine synthase n=1 Tax=Candidatus Methylomirabilis tolerans TaxID=3123416 RepID=A0AAJ1AGV3_9BACT|nr:ABC transporter substrate-binding protein [Candidatus Methylomirabilis sp.]